MRGGRLFLPFWAREDFNDVEYREIKPTARHKTSQAFLMRPVRRHCDAVMLSLKYATPPTAARQDSIYLLSMDGALFNIYIHYYYVRIIAIYYANPPSQKGYPLMPY